MKLQKFKERDNKKIGVIVFTLICLFLISGAILYRTFAIFEVKTNQNVINGTVQGMGDMEFAFYIDDNIVKEAPSKDNKTSYVFDEESSTCTNGASVYWDYQVWGPTVSNITQTKTKCYLKFKTEYSEAILNGAVPQIEGDLVPVTIDENGTVRKADITQEWYNYENQQWANAVITKNSFDILGSNIHGGAEKKEDYVHLDGEDDYIDLGLKNYDFQNSITYVLRTKLLDANDTGDIFCNHQQAGACLIKRNDQLLFSVYDTLSSTYKEIAVENLTKTFGTDLTIIAIAENNKLKLGINGQWSEKTLDTSLQIKPSPESILIAANPFGGTIEGNVMNIDIFQAAVFDRAISEEEATNIFLGNFKILNGKGLLKYLDFSKDSWEVNEIIPEENIESYFVWIPRYKYQLWNGEEETSRFTNVQELGVIGDATKESKLNQQHPIRIEFESKKMPVSESTEKGEYLTHPAFTSFESNGFWVGKFETGYKGATKTAEAEQNIQDISKVIIKPNVYSWRGIQVANASYISQGYKQSLDSHMMKNTEWGAVAYLTNSKYGICPNGKCSEVRINNNSDYVTGNSAVNVPTCGKTGASSDCNKYGTASDTVIYSNLSSLTSSTTNNYYGVYDMAGGAWEYVMGVMLDENNKLVSGRNNDLNSNFVGTLTYPNDGTNTSKTEWTVQDGGKQWPDSKYYDTYEYNTTDEYFKRGIFGDGTKEFGPFYQVVYSEATRHVSELNADDAFFVNFRGPWFVRGGNFKDGTDAGFGAFHTDYGSADSDATFRIILTP